MHVKDAIGTEQNVML